jgi:hypothetical protein
MSAVDTSPRARTAAGLSALTGRTGAAVVALVALAALTWLSLWSVTPPAPRGADIPADEFSAARAFGHVERLAAGVHAAGSPAADSVRSYLVDTLRGLGLRTEVQDGVGATDALGDVPAMARVRNVVALLPGTASSGRVFLVAHYDSVQVSYGANDDGSGVAAILEVARILARDDRPRNDVVLVLTDAEEACLCGAEAFVSQHRLAAEGGVVVNLEARGSSGPAVMFETSTGNANLMDTYADVAPYPVATSFAVDVYRILPNDTDFSVFLQASRPAGRGFVGLNAAYIDGSAAYHTPQDNVSTMDRASLQHHGDNALALARGFARADLAEVRTPAGYDATYFPVLGALVQYPGWLVWPVALLALAAVGALAYLVRRRGGTSWRRLAAGFGLALAPLVAAPLLAQLLWVLLVALRPGYAEMIDPWRPGWFRAAVAALVVAAVLAWYALCRRLGGAALTVGALAWLALLGLVFALVTPGGSYLGALPALAGAGAGIAALTVAAPLARLGLAVAGTAVAVVILAPTVLLFFPALGLATGGAAAFFGAMLALAWLPLLDHLLPAPAAGARGRRVAATPPVAAAVLAVVCLIAGLLVDQFDARHPAPTQLMYTLDADAGQARWVSADADPGEWTRRYVTGREKLAAVFPVLGEREYATGPAIVADLAPPTVSVDSDTMVGQRRQLSLTIRSSREVRFVHLYVPAGGPHVTGATVAGREVPGVRDGGPFTLLFHAPPPAGLRVTLLLSAAGQVTVRASDGSDGLTGLPGFRPRPAGVGVEGSHDSELVLISRSYPV